MAKATPAFSPESMICRVHAEALVLLGGGRSILLQLAHPLVAEAVADYSTFQSDPLGRLFRTLLFMHKIVFDDRRRNEALSRFHAMHHRIQGHLQRDAGPFPVATPYSGTDPDLKLWVHATFVDSTLLTYERFVGPLPPENRQHYYADTLTLGHLMGIPQCILPPTLNDFNSYVKNMIEGTTLSVTETSRRLAREVLRPQVGFVPSASAALLRFVTAGLLPARLRAEYELSWGRHKQLLLDGISHLTQLLRPYVPPWIWQSPLLDGGLSRLLLWEATGSRAERGQHDLRSTRSPAHEALNR